MRVTNERSMDLIPELTRIGKELKTKLEASQARVRELEDSAISSRYLHQAAARRNDD